MYLQCIDLSAIKRDGYWDEAALAVWEGELEAKRIGSEAYRKLSLIHI